ncbi:MAG: malto-oligosyltrehalose synthase [Actinomycetota bacterium]|nr:malto-oligosyltrehalose synthase [Actinomycetota bacterium]
MSELRATYRLQLTPGFGFAAARSLVPYLRDLGISHLYLSPSLQARPGSTHGYDVIDPARMSEALGGEEGFRELAADARAAGMGIVLDVVPNHMAADEGNRFWADPVLREQFFDLDPVSGRHRRFFDIDELAAVRQEDPEVFQATHSLLLGLVREGLVDGLRVDHPDGLADPAGYLQALRDEGVQRVWVEKILDPGEHLRDWPVSGTVGYEFLNDVCALFVDPAGEAPLTELWQRISGDGRSFGEWALEAKLEQASGTFRPEVERLAAELAPPPAMNGDSLRRGRGETPRFGVEELTRALCSLPVYRTYVDPTRGVVTDEDRAALAGVDAALARVLTLEDPAPAAFVTRFQQTTPAIMAKGVEDTAFYRYGRLLALGDVGGDPSRFGITVERFHEGNVERAARFPENLLTTQTHDAKRSADVRARITVLSWMVQEWVATVERWMELTEGLRSGGAPDDPERLFIFQTLVGAWPIRVDRIEAYMEKALREAKRNTNWLEQNAEWEQAVKRFCRALYACEPFLAELQPFAARVAAAGERPMLGQLVLKLTCPGVPDIYQGDEMPFRALVDPDNRRPVDWGWHQAMLQRLMGGSFPDAETRKLFITMRLLGLRARRSAALADGPYRPLAAGEEACAFMRGDDVLVAVATRPEPAATAPVETPRGPWRNVLRGEEHSFRGGEPLHRLLGPRGFGVFERL